MVFEQAPEQRKTQKLSAPLSRKPRLYWFVLKGASNAAVIQPAQILDISVGETGWYFVGFNQ